MTQTALSAQRSSRRFSGLSQKWESGVALFDTTRARFLLLGLIVVFGLVYLWIVNSAATSGFYLTDLERKTARMEDDYRKLLVQETELRSLSHIQEQSKDMALVPVETMEYATGDSAVAIVNQR